MKKRNPGSFKKNNYGGPLYPPINCEDKERMIREGYHPPYININKEVFKSSLIDKEKVKKLKRITFLSIDPRYKGRSL